MGIYRGVGGTGDATTDIEVNTLSALTLAAQTAAIQANTSASGASSSASTATTQASNASTSAASAASSAATATTQASNAATSATSASTSASTATTQASNAATSATSAASSATTATTQASNASSSATSAASSATSASTSATNASSSASSAASSASTATTQASNASTSAASASTSATTASSSAASSSSSATNAASSATAASSSATAAAASAASINDANLVHKTGNETIGGIKTFSSTVVGSVNGNAATVTTNANLTGAITSVGNATTLSNNVVTTAKLSSDLQASTFSFKNRIINGGLILNQRGYLSGTALASGVYGHDRFKGGASGGTYTFTQGALGVNITITITTGSLIQVIEGCNVAENCNYVLSWTGTAQGRLNGGPYGSSGTVIVNGWAPGTNLNVEFNTGTLGNVQLEKGSTATSFDYRPYGTELALCQRYYQILSNSGFRQYTSNVIRIPMTIPVSMRATPVLIKTATGAVGLQGDNSLASTPNTWAYDLQYTAGGTGVIDIPAYLVVASVEL